MDLTIRYATTTDGFRIGYAEAGNGYPLVALPTPPTLDIACARDLFDYINAPLAERFRWIMYDARGCGHSQRPASDFSTEALLRDFEAVKNELQLGRCAVQASSHSVPVALAIAARWPDLVTHLVLRDGWLCLTNHAVPGRESVAALQKTNWEIYTEYWGRVVGGDYGDHVRVNYGRYLRELTDPATHILAMSAWTARDATAFAPLVQAKTLVIHTRAREWLPPEAGRDLAAALPNARLVYSDDLTSANLPDIIAAFVFEGVDIPDPASFARIQAANANGVLSAREREVLALLGAGRSNAQIADALVLSPHTVGRHVANIFHKIDAHTRAEAATWAAHHGLTTSHNTMPKP